MPSSAPDLEPDQAGARRAALESPTRYRSGAVARMLRMPVATLRIWERRYQVSAPVTTASGHRLYSAADVQRLALLRQLTSLGHAIGSLAGLDMAALHQVAATHASTMAGLRDLAPAAPTALPAAWRCVVVGQALALRLSRPALVRQLRQPLQAAAVCADLAAAVPEAQAELLLAQLPSLHADQLPALQALAAACGARVSAVLYRYGAPADEQAMAAAGVQLLREPQDDARLAAWLQQCAAQAGLGAGAAADSTPAWPRRDTAEPAAAGPGAGQGEARVADAGNGPGPARPRRYDDATLTELAGLSSTIACECPSHVAELLMQLSHFEAYSAECASRSPEDAALHAYLQRVAGAGRALFEDALERIAVLEGLMLPAQR